MSYIEFFKHPSHLFFYLKRWGLLDNLSDVAYLKWMYRAYTGEKLNLKTPKTFNEKMQWLKLNNRKPEYTLFSHIPFPHTYQPSVYTLVSDY